VIGESLSKSRQLALVGDLPYTYVIVFIKLKKLPIRLKVVEVVKDLGLKRFLT
jgi:hypothetical protein